MVYRVYVEKKKELANEAMSLLADANNLLGIKGLCDVRLINRYDAENITEELFERYKAFTDILLDNPNIMGFCYTQLYDVEQEQNGIYYYDRTPKFDEETMAKLKAVMNQKAAIEE